MGPLSEPDLPPVLQDPPPLPHHEWLEPAVDAVGECCPPDAACCGDAYGWQLLPQGLIYRTYLAGVKESRFRSVWNNERDDGNIWGSEILYADLAGYRRVGHLRYAPLPGGDVAARAPWRCALGYQSLTSVLSPLGFSSQYVAPIEHAIAQRQLL